MAAFGMLGFFTAFTTGVLGAGGAILFIPLALYGLPLLGVRMDPHGVAALSIVQGLCALASGGLMYARRGHLEYQNLWVGGPALAFGGLAGGVLSAWVQSQTLVLMFAVVATVAAALLLLDPSRIQWPSPAHRRPLAIALFVTIGFLGGAIGVGAGVLVIPVLIYVLGASARAANGTGLVLPAFISIPAFVGKAVSAQVPWDLVPAVALMALAGGALGASITTAIAPPNLRRGLSALTAVLALTVWIQLLARL